MQQEREIRWARQNSFFRVQPSVSDWPDGATVAAESGLTGRLANDGAAVAASRRV